MRTTVIFLAVVLLAIFFRFFMLGNVPPSASLDEATIGWNAYSLLHTGKDEYGYLFPILLRAYDDYRPAFYVYLVIPFVSLLGLSVTAVRLPSVIMSVATVIMTFFLTKNFFVGFKRKITLAFLAMLLLAISPWHIYISRLGHEVNLGLTLIVISLLLFFLSVNKKSGALLIASYVFFGVSFYSYQSEKVFTPLILFLLICIYFRDLWQMRKQFLVGIALFVLISLPIFFVSLSPGALLRLKGTSVFVNNPAYTVSAQKILSAKQKGDIFGQILNNRRVVTGEIFLQNYFSHFNPFWLFGNTGNEQFKAPNTGLLYIWEAPFLLLGILYFFLSKKIDKKIKIFFVAWILVAFLAPGLTTGAPHAMRAYTLLPLPQIMTALGLFTVVAFLQKQSKGITFGFILLLSVIAFQYLIQFFTNYFVIFPRNQSQSFQYAITDAMQYVAQNENKYKMIVISNKDNLYQSYMFYLFYSKYNPVSYHKEGGTISAGFNQTHKINNIVFRPIEWNVDEKMHGLFVGNSTDFPSNIKPAFQTYYLDGSPGVTIVEN